LIYQKIHNYEGFTFIDTAAENYRLKPTDRCAGTVPQPHREFIAVLSLGGEEIDMNKYIPNKSQYSNLMYKTIFGETRCTPIRTTYTYYAPLPNPLQFEYLSNNYIITDSSDTDTLKFLPKYGKANLTFDMDASTEYSYYWIRNAGHDVDYDDPSLAIEGKDSLGDGVFGYLVYDIPKGMGGYKITLPTKADGSYDINSIVQIDGDDYHKWLDNPNTKDSIEIKEDEFQYHVFIPQILIPPALDDDNNDGIEDWLDDRGDRFCSATGFLHDNFILDDGELWRDYPETPFQDDIYGMVDSGWYHGADDTYGDDFFENLGKTHFKIKAIYEGKGKEGPVDISKGGWLVVEEIFGGSPWVIFSHSLSGYAKGVDYQLTSRANPTLVKFGRDTIYIKHTIADTSEPHEFNANFDPYLVSYGYGEATATTYAGGKDPCSLISPALTMPIIIDPQRNRYNFTLIPNADASNPDLVNYPRSVSGVFLEARIELMNGTDDNLIFTNIKPVIPAELGNTSVEMKYVAYPRPLVPAKVDPSTGEIIQGGDDIGTFRAGWRFNQPEGEVLIKMGDTLPLIQPSRRGYFIFLFKIDDTLSSGVYDIGFKMSALRKHYTENKADAKKDNPLAADYSIEIPPLQFSIAERNSAGNVVEYSKFVIDKGDLKNIQTKMTGYSTGLEKVKWSLNDINSSNFASLPDTLPAIFDDKTGIETIDLSRFKNFPSTANSKFYILEKADIYSYYGSDKIDITSGENLNYSYNSSTMSVSDKKINVNPVGPRIKALKSIYSVNGIPVGDGTPYVWSVGADIDIKALFELTNYGNDIADNTKLKIYKGMNFEFVQDSLPANTDYIPEDSAVLSQLGAFMPGQTKQLFINFTASNTSCDSLFDDLEVISRLDISYKGTAIPQTFMYPDTTPMGCIARDLRVFAISAPKTDIKRGETVTIKTKYQNNIIQSASAWIRVYAVVNGADTSEIGSRLLNKLNSSELSEFDTDYTVGDTVEQLYFYAKIDADDDIPEICENNNLLMMSMPLDVPISVDAGKDVVICHDSCASFNAIVKGGIPPYKVSWSPTEGLDDTTSLNPQICLRYPGKYNYVITVWDANHYKFASDTVNIRVRTTPLLKSSETLHDFGELDACTSSRTDTLDLINWGKEDITIDSISTSPGFFYVQPALPILLKGGENKKIYVKYAPVSDGATSGSMEALGKPCGVYLKTDLKGFKQKLTIGAQPMGVDFGRELFCRQVTKDTIIQINNLGTGDILLKFSKTMLNPP
ncbi:MAG: hypothetical protein QG635_1060, partial [Bacteroidota bacterium]|nr:hypothetical protein [Bacteroidota bacterium]